MAAVDEQYSVSRAKGFGWNSLTGELISERAALLRKYVVGPTVLDAGCGGGGVVDFLCRQGFEATGVDKFSMFLEIASERKFLGRFLQADLNERLPFPDRSFDTTICLDVLEHVPDDRVAIRELARVTRGRLVIAVPQEDQWMGQFRLALAPYRDPTHLRYYTPDRLRELVQSVNPARVEIFGEQQVPIRHLVHELMVPTGRYRLLTDLYRRLQSFVMSRCKGPEIYINLAAIVDLTSPG
ncbi:class I SAM-dependent methyltransferase [Frigoriglobus tundricola]|uniref:Methyltransferase type 11 domain-containing protein n=1 Tax=Frigoriglobus tundricola TaxID=2774151 RepID=A0A6M5YH70_9BACT|nr:class I SAM-dependent methyltransferase [Frigoriglobus tundricola]QJW92711.1 hypothetical protein FTUN_0208 [Frigoriglobus tundricola]